MPEIICRVIDCHVFRLEDDEPLYLLLKRAGQVIYADSWRMVGGKIENGEKAYETALRELKEETGLKPLHFWAAPFVNNFYEASHDRINMIPVFAAEVTSEDVKLTHEHSDYQWMTYDEALEALPWPAQQEGLRIVHEFIVAQKEVSKFVEIKI
ncbi:NUDIX domain-containing protein [bacterium]|nr:NUDIX domain-containing protein [bacterium]